MRPLKSLLLYLAALLFGGALLAPWLYWLAQSAAGHWPAVAPLASNPFSRFVARAILGLALAGLWPLLRVNGMLEFREVGLTWADRPIRRMLAGLAMGFASLACVALLATLCGARALSHGHTGGEWLNALINAACSALIVAILEELLFRGAIFGVLRKVFSPPAAIAASAAVYAAAHFLQKAPSPDAIGWLSGLQLLPKIFAPAEGGLPWIPAFLTLWTAGAILALAFHRTGGLYLSIGLHAGWIFWLKFYQFLSAAPRGTAGGFWGGDRLLDGWLPLIILGGLLSLMLWSGRPRCAGNSSVA